MPLPSLPLTSRAIGDRPRRLRVEPRLCAASAAFSSARTSSSSPSAAAEWRSHATPWEASSLAVAAWPLRAALSSAEAPHVSRMPVSAP
eukprot:scaffold91474_cov48-Phaeocystis_antarctica.AAC.1